MENLKFVLVGHVDHGKSTLIGRLFYDTDSLPKGKFEEIKETCKALGRDMEFGFVMDHLDEERDQGITIDTAQTFFNTDKRQYTIIDAPGHVEFVKNMITGASQAEAAILLVDANEGIQEQTRRHAYILSMLGLNQVVVAMNKMDLVEYDEKRYKEVKQNLEDFLQKINIEPSYIIPISAKEGDFVAKKTENLDWFDGPTILEALDTFETKKAPTEKPLRLSIQDVYNFEKRIAAGRVESGIIKQGDEITILPSKEKTKVKSIEEFGREGVDMAKAGKSTGITTEDKVFIDRGNIIVKDNKPKITNTINAHVFWMDKQPFKKGERLLFKCGTQEVMCDIEKIKDTIDASTLETIETDAKEIKNRQVADVTIKTEKPVVIENFNDTPELGRFVFERKDTCAGGIITEN